MTSRLLAPAVLVGLALPAAAVPTASFTARKIQGSTCVAPCAVHFDAIGDICRRPTVPPVRQTLRIHRHRHRRREILPVHPGQSVNHPGPRWDFRRHHPPSKKAGRRLPDHPAQRYRRKCCGLC